MIMERPENDKWLDEALTETIGSEKPRTDFDAWKRNHPQAVQMLTTRANRQTSVTVRSFSLRNTIMKSPLTKIAAAAIVIIACGIGLSLWKTTGSGIALADVLTRVEQVNAYRYKSSHQSWGEKVTGKDPNKPYNVEAHVTILKSQEYGSKVTGEILDPHGGWSKTNESYYLLPKRTLIIIGPKQKKYRRTEFDDRWAEGWQDGPVEMTKRMLEYKYESLGRSTIDGIEVEGFRTTDPNYGIRITLGESKIQADQKIWVDVKTRLPVRYDGTYVSFYEVGNKKQYSHNVLYDFQWDVPVDAAEFEPVIPDDYTGIVIRFPAHLTEETTIQGLKVWVELLGKYPENIPIEADFADVGDTVLRLAEKSETPAAMRLKEEIKGLTDEQIKNKLVDFLMPIRGLDLFYMRLQWGKKDRAYYGKTVTPTDADKVLMRWKVSDNEYRVIYGDLHAETVTPEKLAELEKALPK
jgi:hypothetical protein